MSVCTPEFMSVQFLGRYVRHCLDWAGKLYAPPRCAARHGVTAHASAARAVARSDADEGGSASASSMNGHSDAGPAAASTGADTVERARQLLAVALLCCVGARESAKPEGPHYGAAAIKESSWRCDAAPCCRLQAYVRACSVHIEHLLAVVEQFARRRARLRLQPLAADVAVRRVRCVATCLCSPAVSASCVPPPWCILQRRLCWCMRRCARASSRSCGRFRTVPGALKRARVCVCVCVCVWCVCMCVCV
jgi:hypothetical protein